MQDAIIKGIGNSRYLKTVGEALSLYPTYEDFLQAMIAGTFPIDFNGINKDGWTQQGTPLNKANLLSDTVISTLGLSTGANSTPNDAFNVLANVGNVHVWRKTVVAEEEVPAGYKLVDDNTDRTLDDVPNALINLGNSNQRTAYINCADSITVDDGGGISLNSATTHYQANDALNAASWLRGKYIKLYYINDFGNWFGPPALDQNKTYYVPNDAQISVNSATIIVDKLQRVDAYPLTPAGTHITYLTSVNRNAYQEGDDAKEAGYVLGEVVTGKTAISMTYNRCSITYCSAIEVNNNGTISPAPNSGGMNIPTNNMDSDDLSALKGKFFHTEGSENDSDQIGFFSDPNYWAYIPEDAVITMETHPVGSPAIYITKYQPVTGYPAIPAGTTIEYLGVLGEKSKIQVLSYVGTGTSGEANACSVTASFPIEVLFFLGYTGTIYSDPDATGIVNGYWGDRETGVMFGKYLTTTFAERMAFNGNNGMSLGKKSADGKTFYWYNRTAVVTNASGLSYYFLALG